jgi:hypothetical protein
MDPTSPTIKPANSKSGGLRRTSYEEDHEWTRKRVTAARRRSGLGNGSGAHSIPLFGLGDLCDLPADPYRRRPAAVGRQRSTGGPDRTAARLRFLRSLCFFVAINAFHQSPITGRLPAFLLRLCATPATLRVAMRALGLCVKFFSPPRRFAHSPFRLFWSTGSPTPDRSVRRRLRGQASGRRFGYRDLRRNWYGEVLPGSA